MDTQTLTVMIVDLVGSTPLVEQASRLQLVELMEDATQPIRQAVAQFGGTVIKFTGDGYLATFTSASEALCAAVEVIDSFRSQPKLPSGISLEGCRVILNTADCILQDNDVIGEGVVTAARLEKHVPTNEIYLTSTTHDVAKSSEFEFELMGDYPLKGLVNPVKVYRLKTEPYAGIEHNVCLTITDLLGMNALMSQMTVDQVNSILQRWITLQREAATTVGGRLRAIVGDNLVSSFPSADGAMESLLRLETLVNAHNDAPGKLPVMQFTAIACLGDLYVLSIGINGPLVSRAFRLLDAAAKGSTVVDAAVYSALSQHQNKFVPLVGG